MPIPLCQLDGYDDYTHGPQVGKYKIQNSTKKSSQVYICLLKRSLSRMQASSRNVWLDSRLLRNAPWMLL